MNASRACLISCILFTQFYNASQIHVRTQRIIYVAMERVKCTSSFDMFCQPRKKLTNKNVCSHGWVTTIVSFLHDYNNNTALQKRLKHDN